MKNAQWFSVDKEGLGRQAVEQSKGRLIGELVSNSLDEEGVTQIALTLALVPGQELADLKVEDDSPEGFRNLSDAYTLFAESYKRRNVAQRGRYNLGEKLVLAICEQATISTTTGTVAFDPEQGRIENPDQKRERGSVFTGRIRMNEQEYSEVCDYLRSLLLPQGVSVSFNGQPILPRQPVHTFTASLETLIADDKGVMRPTTRKTEISLYEPLPGETAGLYELGMPVVESGDRFHVNVGQKVPLNKDRNNVKPAFLKAARTHVLNAVYDRLTETDASEDWVRQASSDPNCSPEALKKVLTIRFGDKFAAFDPNDKEAGKAWIAKGGRLVYGPELSANEWKRAKEEGLIESVGKVCPSPKPYSKDKDAENFQVIPTDKWTPGMKKIADYAVFLGQELMGVPVTISFVNTANNFAACYGPGDLHFNLFRLGHKWFEQGVTEEVDRLLIHEFGHQFSGDHLSEEYHDALCLLAARLKKVALDKPDALRQFS